MADQAGGHLNLYMFVLHTGLLMSYFIMSGILQWMLLCIYMKHGHIVYTMICFFAALLLLTCIHFSEFLKYGKPWNYVAILTCYELLTLGVTSFIVDSSAGVAIGVILGAIFLWGAILAGCYAIIRFVKYPNPYILSGAGVVGLMISITMVAVDQVLDARACGEIALVIVLISVIIMLVSHVLMTYDSKDVLTKVHTLLLAFVLYLNYVIIMVIIFIFVIRNRRYKYEECKTSTTEVSVKRLIEATEAATNLYKPVWEI